jgi:hypothetical protein
LRLKKWAFCADQGLMKSDEELGDRRRLHTGRTQKRVPSSSLYRLGDDELERLRVEFLFRLQFRVPDIVCDLYDQWTDEPIDWEAFCAEVLKVTLLVSDSSKTIPSCLKYASRISGWARSWNLIGDIHTWTCMRAMQTIVWWHDGAPVYSQVGPDTIVADYKAGAERGAEFFCLLVQHRVRARLPTEATGTNDFSWKLSNWVMSKETLAEHERRARHEFELWLKRSQHKALESMTPDYIRSKNKREREHFDWVIDHQVRGYTYPQIARAANRSVESVKNETTELKRELGLTGMRRGRPRRGDEMVSGQDQSKR